MKPGIIAVIFFLILSLTASLFLVARTTNFFGKASTVNTSPITMENSYLFSSPLQAKADSQELIRITVFLLDSRGLGVPNQTVELLTPANITIKDVQAVSDESGKAVFDLSSAIPGQFTIGAQAASREIPQKVKIVFF